MKAQTAACLFAVAFLAIAFCGCYHGEYDRDYHGYKAPAMGKEASGAPSIMPRALGRPWQDLRQHTFSGAGKDTCPNVSADGKWLLFCSTNDSVNPDIYMKPIDGQLVVRKTTAASNDMFPKISPDGKKIAFASDRAGNWDIYIIDTQYTATVWQVTTATSDDIHPSWSPDGKKIVFSSKVKCNEWQMWIIDLETRSMTNLGPGLFPEWSPIENKILFQKPSGVGEHWYSTSRRSFQAPTGPRSTRSGLRTASGWFSPASTKARRPRRNSASPRATTSG
jgi:hypothetical protein